MTARSEHLRAVMMFNGKLGIFAESELTKPDRVRDFAREAESSFGTTSPFVASALDELARAEDLLMSAYASVELARSELATYLRSL